MTRAQGRSTYTRLIKATQVELWERGFKAARLDRIAARAGVTKGALYHHFPDKRSLALAALMETMDRTIDELWIQPLAADGDPLPRLFVGLAHHIATGAADIHRHLPRLIADFAAHDPAAHLSISERLAHGRKRLAAGLARARHAGFVRADIDCDAAALFILSSWEGCQEAVRYAHPAILFGCGQELLRYIGALRGHADRRVTDPSGSWPAHFADTSPSAA